MVQVTVPLLQDSVLRAARSNEQSEQCSRGFAVLIRAAHLYFAAQDSDGASRRSSFHPVLRCSSLAISKGPGTEVLCFGAQTWVDNAHVAKQ